MISPYTLPGTSNDLPALYCNPDALKIAEEVADLYDIRVKDMIIRTRKPIIVEARQMAMVRIYREVKLISLQDTVELFGIKGHATLIHAMKTIDNRTDMNQLLYQVNIIEYNKRWVMVNGKSIPKKTTRKRVKEVLRNKFERKAYYRYINSLPKEE